MPVLGSTQNSPVFQFSLEIHRETNESQKGGELARHETPKA